MMTLKNASPHGTTIATPTRTRSLLFLAVFLSGFSGLTNQVIWQRSLKLVLGGAESLSSMIVVLVFMAGLGIGSLLAGYHTLQGARPFRCLAGVELWLALLNCGVWFLLILQVDSYFVAAQAFALSVGLPLKLAKALLSLLVLAVPCCLMGMTTPYAAAALQASVSEAPSKNTLPLLFFFNTVGGLVGAVATGWYFLPYTGQRAGLLVAIVFNLAAAGFAWAMRGSDSTQNRGSTLSLRGRLGKAETAAFLSGAVALAYEILLFRSVSLTYEPRPQVFSLVLCLFLLTWSFGVWLSSRLPWAIPTILHYTAASLCLVPAYLALDRFHFGSGLWPWLLVYFVPVVLFGLLYGQLVKEAANTWGRDVGRFYFLNTTGSCLGIVLMSLLGFEFSLEVDCFVLAGALLLTSFLYRRTPDILIPLVLNLVLAGACYMVAVEAQAPNRGPVYYGEDGVVEIVGTDVIIDGLWHSKLASGDYLATNNWMMAIAPILAHQKPEDIKDVLVVGFGTGITSHVFAGHPGIEAIESYETNRTLRNVFEDFAAATMHVLDNPRVKLFWQDGRSGLELRDKEYDIITSAPLYLKQAGSANLLSEEYFLKAKKRLKPGGVIAVYSNGNPAQALLVRKTLGRVFPHTASILNGYLLLGSEDAMSLHAERIKEFESKDWPIARELKTFNENSSGFASIIDKEILWEDSTPYFISDNHPLVEYPNAAARLLKMDLPPE